MLSGLITVAAALVAAQHSWGHSSACAGLIDGLRNPSESARLAVGGTELALACADAKCMAAECGARGSSRGFATGGGAGGRRGKRCDGQRGGK